MQIQSTRFGLIEVDESTVITFPQGLSGFEQLHRFKLIHEDKPDPQVLWLQSLDEADVSFNLVEAGRLGIHYQITLDDAECELLQLAQAEDAALLLLLYRADDGKGGIQANTQAPIVLNLASRLALQKTGLRANIVFSN